MRTYRVDYSTKRHERNDDHRTVVVATNLPDALRQVREDMIGRWPDVDDYKINEVDEICHGAPWLIF